MDLTRTIIGSIVTEKAERLKMQRTYTLKVAGGATKVDIKNALRKFFDVEVTSVRVQRVRAKKRPFGRGEMTKRKPYKKVMVTLASGSKALDLAQFKTA